MEFQARLFTFLTQKNLNLLENKKPDLNLSIQGNKLLFSSSSEYLEDIETNVYMASKFNVKKNFSGLVRDFLQKGPQDKKISPQREASTNSAIDMGYDAEQDKEDNRLETFLSDLIPEIRNKLLYLPPGVNKSEEVLFLEGFMSSREINIDFLLVLPEKLKELSPSKSHDKFELSFLKQNSVYSTDLEVEMLYGKTPNEYDVNDKKIISLFPDITESQKTIKIPPPGKSLTIKKQFQSSPISIKFGDILPVKKSTLEKSGEQLVILEKLDLMLKVSLPSPQDNLNFPRQYLNLRHLGFLDLSKLGITSIPYDIDVLTNLKFLNLSGNNISTIPHSLIALVYKLIYLDLSDNKLEYNVPHSNGQTALLMPKDFKDAVELRELEMIKEPEDGTVTAEYFESYKDTEGGVNLEGLRNKLAGIYKLVEEEITKEILEDFIFKNIEKIEVTYKTGKDTEKSTLYKLDLRLENQKRPSEKEEPQPPSPKAITEMVETNKSKKKVEQHFKTNNLVGKIQKHNDNILSQVKRFNPEVYIKAYISYVSLLKEKKNYNVAIPGISDFQKNFSGQIDKLRTRGFIIGTDVVISADVINLWFLFFQMNVISHLFTPDLASTITDEEVRNKITRMGNKLGNHKKLREMYIVTLLKKDILARKKKAQLDKIIEKYPFIDEITQIGERIDEKEIAHKMEIETEASASPLVLSDDIMLEDLLEYHTLVLEEKDGKILNTEKIKHTHLQNLESVLTECLELESQGKKRINTQELEMFDKETHIEVNIKNLLLILDRINDLNIKFASQDPRVIIKKRLLTLLRDKYEKSLGEIFEYNKKTESPKKSGTSENEVSEILKLFKSSSQKNKGKKVEEVDDIEHYANIDRIIAMQTNNRDIFKKTKYGKVLALLDYIKAKKIEWFLENKESVRINYPSPKTTQLSKKFNSLPEINFIRNVEKYISDIDFHQINLVLQEMVDKNVKVTNGEELHYLLNLIPPLTIYQKIINYNKAIDRFELGSNHKIKKLPPDLKKDISDLDTEKEKTFQIIKESKEQIILRQIRRNAKLFLGNEVDMTILDGLELAALNLRLTSILEIKKLYLEKTKYEFVNKEEILRMLKYKIRELLV